MKVVIVDYQMSNLFSVLNACITVGLDAKITSLPSDLIKADLTILPGVGAFGDAMKNLTELGLTDVIVDETRKGKPLVGICLGLQLLFDESNEFGPHKGLGLISGKVKRFPAKYLDKDLRVPQIGWNNVYRKMDNAWQDTPLENVENNSYMYFVHSYYVEPGDQACVLSYTEYEGFEYCSGVRYNNIVAFQFHPEKSGNRGLQIYKDFGGWAKKL